MAEIPKRGGGGSDVWEKFPNNPVFFFECLPNPPLTLLFFQLGIELGRAYLAIYCTVSSNWSIRHQRCINNLVRSPTDFSGGLWNTTKIPILLFTNECPTAKYTQRREFNPAQMLCLAQRSPASPIVHWNSSAELEAHNPQTLRPE